MSLSLPPQTEYLQIRPKWLLNQGTDHQLTSGQTPLQIIREHSPLGDMDLFAAQ